MLARKYIRRLEKVRDAVKATPPKEIDMSAWQCGTKCCAVGAFCLANPSAKLALSPPQRSGEVEYRAPFLRGEYNSWGGPLDDFDAVEKYFGLTDMREGDMDASCHLFAPEGTQRGVVAKREFLKRINAFIKEHRA